MRLIDADKLLKTIQNYKPAMGANASPGFVAGVYYCLYHVMPVLIRAAVSLGGMGEEPPLPDSSGRSSGTPRHVMLGVPETDVVRVELNAISGESPISERRKHEWEE